MANKKINELDSRSSLSLSDLMAVGDPSTGYLYKTTISDLKTLTGAGVVSFNGRFGSVVPAEGDYSLTQLSDVIITSASNNQVLRYNGSNWVNATIDLSGYVPYTGATANVNLGTFDLTADVITGATGSFASSGGSNTFAINHSSGSGIALNITKGGNGEGIYVNKTSGSGNAATIVGTLEATTLVKTGGTSAQFLKANGSVDSSTYLTTSSASSTYVPLTRTLTINGTAYDLSADRTWTIPTHDAVTIGTANGLSLSGQALSLALSSTSSTGALSSTDWNTFNGKQAALNGTGFVKISGTTISYDNTSYLSLAGGTMTGQIILKESSSSSDFTKGLRFPNDPYGGTGDVAGLRLYTTSVEDMVLELYVGNDPTGDKINFATGIGATANNDSVTINGNKIWNAGNLANPIIGTGTSNYVSKFTASGTIGDTVIYDNGTNVTIGGTASLNKLSVISGATFSVSTPNTYALGVANGGGNDMTLGTSSTYGAIQCWSEKPLALNPSGNNVLIGTTTNSTFKLDVSGTGRFTGALTGTSAAFTGLVEVGGITSEGNISVSGVESGVSANYYGTYSGGSTELTFLYNSAGSVIWNNGGTKMSLSSAGALQVVGGISATSATFSDIVTNTTGGYRTLASQGYILRNDANNGNLGGLTRRGYWVGSSALDTQIFAETGYGIFLNVNGSQAGMVITSGGSVLIGTSNSNSFDFVGATDGKHSYLGNTIQISASDFGGTERQSAMGVAEWANQTNPVINLASIFPRISMSSRALGVLVQITTNSSSSDMCSALVLFARSSNGTWSAQTIGNIQIGGLVLTGRSGSGTSITLNFSQANFGSATITIMNRA